MVAVVDNTVQAAGFIKAYRFSVYGALVISLPSG